MKIKLLTIIACLVLSVNSAFAKSKKDNVKKYLFELTTYTSDGQVIKKVPGFFISSKGEGIASYDAFKDAAKASVTIDGKKPQVYDVTRIEGANETYNVVKFKTSASSTESLSLGVADSSFAMVTLASKDNVCLKVLDRSLFKNYSYYTFDILNADSLCGLPVINSRGEAIAILQKNYQAGATKICGLDLHILDLLKISSVSFADASLKGIKIYKSLPEDEAEALSYLYLFTQSSRDSMACEIAFSDFISQFPDNYNGLVERANFHARNNQWNLVEDDINSALKVSKKKDDVYYEYSKLLIQNLPSDTLLSKSKCEEALSQVQLAYKENPEPVYILQQANCYYLLKRYKDAFENYQKVNNTNLASSESYSSAARALSKFSNDTIMIISLLDSCILHCPEPYSKASATYFLERGRFLDVVGRYRLAVQDYNKYEQIYEYKGLTSAFYIMREGAELKGKLYQQALDDIDKVIEIERDKGPFYLEKSVIYLTAGEYSLSLEPAKQAQVLMPNEPEVNRILGICYGENNDYVKAQLYLNKAKELGDTTAESLISRYKK